MVKVRYEGRLGNVLFQYCLGRIIASHLGFALKAEAIPGFPHTGEIEGRRPAFFRGGTERIEGHVVDLRRILSNTSVRKIKIHGFFMHYEYYRDHKSQISDDWLWQPENYRLDKKHLSIHIRGGDIWQRNGKKTVHPDYMALPLSYYQQIIDEGGWSGITIVTEDRDDPIAHRLVKLYAAELKSGTAIDDFNYLRSSSNIVMSVSTFSWWAAWLSNAAAIFYPRAGFLNPDIRPEVRLIVDEPRYLVQTLPGSDVWTGSNADLEHLLSS